MAVSTDVSSLNLKSRNILMYQPVWLVVLALQLLRAFGFAIAAEQVAVTGAVFESDCFTGDPTGVLAHTVIKERAGLGSQTRPFEFNQGIGAECSTEEHLNADLADFEFEDDDEDDIVDSECDNVDEEECLVDDEDDEGDEDDEDHTVDDEDSADEDDDIFGEDNDDDDDDDDETVYLTEVSSCPFSQQRQFATTSLSCGMPYSNMTL